MEKVLELKHISHAYHTPKGETPALQNISFSVVKGEFIATKKEDKSEAPKAVVTFLYDKKEERLISLAQDEVSAVSGFVNDMDGGINFTPDFFTGGKMYQIVEADLFMEYAQTSDSPRMKRIAERISEDSNPVMIEATFK